VPRVTVFMPVHNNARYLSGAVASILEQSFSDLELLIIDDGSTDETSEVLDSLSDSRVRIVRNDTNLGIPVTRNLGLDLARGEFLAFLDSDDIARPDRLDKQLGFLEANPDHVAVGSWATEIDEEGVRHRTLRRPLSWDRIRARTLFLGTIRTPSVTGRVDILRKFRFLPEFPVCSDSDYWVRVAQEHKCANLAEPLIDYRIHPSSITKGQKSTVRRYKMSIAAYQLDALGMKFNQQDLLNHFQLRKPKNHDFNERYIEWAQDWLKRLVVANQRSSVYPDLEFNRAVGERWCAIYLSCRGQSNSPIQLFDSRMRDSTLPYLSRGIPLGLRYGFGVA
jgi:glycosyltransferase involved in cell wall biosynthesis